MHQRSVAALIAIVPLMAWGHVRAEPIQDFALVTSGQVLAEPLSDGFSMRIFGSQFDFQGGGIFFLSGGITPNTPGPTVFDLSAPISLSGRAFSSTDQTFHYQGALFAGSGTLDFFTQPSGPTSGPDPRGLGFRIDTPFVMLGRLFGDAVGPPSPNNLQLDILGAGTATGIFAGITDPQGAGTGQYRLNFLTYSFSPIPEPATWALVATGLLGLAGVRRLQRRR